MWTLILWRIHYPYPSEYQSPYTARILGIELGIQLYFRHLIINDLLKFFRTVFKVIFIFDWYSFVAFLVDFVDAGCVVTYLYIISQITKPLCEYGTKALYYNVAVRPQAISIKNNNEKKDYFIYFYYRFFNLGRLSKLRVHF